MISTEKSIPKVDIKDILGAIDSEEVCGTEENENEFLLIKSRNGISTQQPHTTNYYNLSIALKGNCKQEVNENEITLAPGYLFFASPRDITVTRKCSSDLKIQQILFTKRFLLEANISREALEELLWVDPGKPPLFQLDNDAFRKVKQLFEKLAEEASLSRPYYKQILRNGIIELLFRINRLEKSCLKKGSQKTSQSNRLYKEFKDLIDEHFIERKKVSDYAELLHVTPKYLSEVVKEESSTTALEHIHERIMREARNQLIYTDKSAKEIAYHLGFNTPSQFGRFFKRRAGQSPIQFRKSRKTEH